MEPLKRKKIARGVLRSHCQKIEARIKELFADDLDSTQLIELKSLRMNYKDKIAKIQAADEEVFNLINDEDELEKEM